jgi:hypothetical protein
LERRGKLTEEGVLINWFYFYYFLWYNCSIDSN